MTDVVDKATRSRMMSGIRGTDTQPELRLRKALHSRGYRYRLHVRALPGRPDLVLPRYRAVILVHGCFWHRHKNCRYATTPATRPDFWAAKFAATVARDARQLTELRSQSWRVATIWECALRTNDIGSIADSLSDWLHSNAPEIEIPSAQA